MAVSLTTNTYNRRNWEDSDFPILCQTCLGDNPYMRMTKEKYGKECKICTRPFTVFRWCPGARMRFKKTEVCQTCAKIKNVCQTCLLDLEYGLPIQVRDAALRIKDDLPRSDVNREYYIQNVDRELATANEGGNTFVGKIGSQKNELLMKLARTTPYYKRNRPHICSFWVKGECKRGEECPYRHERPSDPDDPLSDQNIRDRYYGTNDPVAEKLLKRAESLPKLDVPEDKLITTLYVGGISESTTEANIRDAFYHFGEIRQVTMVPKQGCAFVQFCRRAAAEAAADKTFENLIILGRKVTIRWGKSQAKQDQPNVGLTAVPGLPPSLPPPPIETQNPNFFNLMPSVMAPPPPPPTYFGVAGPSTSATYNFGPPGIAVVPPPPPPGLPIHYPSQDPSRMGASS